MIEQNELLWRLYQDNRSFAQFHESQRATVTGLVAGGNAALVAAMIGSDGLSRNDLPFALMAFFIGIIGLTISLKSTEKLRRHNKRAAKFLQKIKVTDSSLDINSIKSEVDKAQDKKHWFTSKFRQSTLWIGIHYGVVTLSIFVLFKIFSTTNSIIEIPSNCSIKNETRHLIQINA